MFDTCQGLALETVDGAALEDVTITNISMRAITSAPIFLRLGSRMRGPQGVPVGTLRRILISNLVSSNSPSRLACMIMGIPGHPVEDVKLSNIYLQHPGGGTEEDAAIEPPEKEAAYPEPNMFGPLPAHGFFIRHAAGVEMNDIKLKIEKPDGRPCFFLEDVHDATFVQMKLPKDSAKPVFVLKDVSDIAIVRSKPVADIEIDQADHREL